MIMENFGELRVVFPGKMITLCRGGNRSRQEQGHDPGKINLRIQREEDLRAPGIHLWGTALNK